MRRIGLFPVRCVTFLDGKFHGCSTSWRTIYADKKGNNLIHWNGGKRKVSTDADGLFFEVYLKNITALTSGRAEEKIK